MILESPQVRIDPLASKRRYGIALIGPYNAVERVYSFPEPIIHTPPTMTARLYHNGRRMDGAEYEIFESVLGSGNYDRVRVIAFAPKPSSTLIADYSAA